MTFYRDDFAVDGKKHTFMIKKNQIKGLLESAQFKGVVSRLILNYRKTNHTYYFSINDFVSMTSGLDKKSFNEEDVKNNKGYLIEQELKRTNYRYNIQKFIDDFKGVYNI